MMSQPCRAKSSQTGQPCRRWARVGSSVCPSHGGNAPQVKRAADARIRDMAEGPALEALDALVRDVKNPSVRLAAARDLLDRAGFGARQKVDLNVIHQEAAAIAEEFGVPIETVYQYAGLPMPN